MAKNLDLQLDLDSPGVDISRSRSPYPEDFSLFKETVKGLPKAAGEVGQSFARGFAASAATPIAGYMSIAESVKQGKPTFVQPEFDPSRSKLSSIVFGDKKFTPTSEATDIQDIFRKPETRGTVSGFTPFLMGGLALADIPSGGTASKVFINVFGALNKSSKAVKTADNVGDVTRILRTAKVSDEVIDSLDLGRRLADTTDDAELARIFREAAGAEANLQTSLRGAPTRGQVSRQTAARTPQPETPIVPKRVGRTDVPTTPVRSSPNTVGTQAGLRKAVVEQADEAAFVRDEVMPPTQRLESLNQFGRDTVAYTIDTVRKSDGIIPQVIENNFRTIAGSLGANTDLPLKQLVNQVTKQLDQAPAAIRQQFEAPDNFFYEQVTDIPDYLRKNRQAGFMSLPDAFKKRKQTAAAKEVESRISIPISSVDDISTQPTTAPRQTQDDVINRGLERYRVEEAVPAEGDTTLAKLAAKATKRGARDLAGDLLVPISSRLGRINPKLKFKLRNLEFKTRANTQADLEQALPLLNSTKKMTPADRTAFDLARKNGDTEVIDAIISKYDIADEYNAYRKMLDGIFKRAEAAGIEISYRGDYSPRMVKNPQDFVAYLRGQDDWGEIQKAIAKKAEDKGVAYTDLSDEEIAGIANSMLRGYGDRVTLAAPGAAKARSIETIGPELNKFYENSDAALLAYVHKMNDEIEARKFFGRDVIKGKGDKARVVNPLTGQETTVTANNSIGAYVADLLAKGEITAKQQDEVTQVLQARFKKGEMNSFIAAYRDLEYISTMGNPISAMTQFGDLVFNVYKNGWYNTLRGIGTVLTDSKRLRKEDFGLERIAQEFDNPARTSKVLEKVFKLVGMEQVDRLGKESFIAASRNKLKNLARKDDPALVSELHYMFDTEDAIRALDELKADAITPRTKEVLFNRLLDIQPLAKSEMPQKYLEMPNGRIFYMLKSFTLKQFDIFRREAIDKIASGSRKERIEGVRNLVYLSGLFMLGNAAVDEMKDFVLGRETSLKDRTIDNIFRLLGATKYDVYKSREEGVGTTVLRKILPPASLWDRLSTDVSNLAEDRQYERGPLEGERYKSEAIQSIPGGGKLYYWWFGRGAQKQEYKAGGMADESDIGIDLDLDLDLNSSADIGEIDLGLDL